MLMSLAILALLHWHWPECVWFISKTRLYLTSGWHFALKNPFPPPSLAILPPPPTLHDIIIRSRWSPSHSSCLPPWITFVLWINQPSPPDSHFFISDVLNPRIHHQSLSSGITGATSSTKIISPICGIQHWKLVSRPFRQIRPSGDHKNLSGHKHLGPVYQVRVSNST